MKHIAAVMVAVGAFTTVAHAQEAPVTPQALDDYTISRQDVLGITVIDQPDLTAKYTVEADGTIRFPLIGRVPMAGRTLRQAEAELKRALADGYLKNPQIAVSLDQFRGRRIFIIGAVGAGTYPLADGETIVEALVKVGAGLVSEIVILRSKGATAPRMPSGGVADEVIRVNLREFEKEVEQGVFTRNIPLQDGDTIFIPRFDKSRIFVTGQVKAPGAFSVPEGTTVLQALALAGGVTEAASIGRIRILRIVDGERKTVKAEVNDVVQAGDTITVPERFF